MASNKHGQNLLASKNRHTRFLLKSPMLTPHARSQHRQRVMVAMCLMAMLSFATPTPVYANTTGMFDSLLKMILPFYKKDKTSEEELPDQYIDDGTDEGWVLDDETDERFELPSMLFDDMLVATDSIEVLGEPDLYELLLAEFNVDRGDVKGALSVYKAESFKKNATAVFERALSLSLEYEDPASSLAFASAWQRQNPEHIPAWFYMAHLALKAGDYHQAVRTLAMIVRYDAKADLTQILTGIIPDDPNAQKELFDALSIMDDSNPAISVLRAGLLMRLGDYPPALLHVNTALNKDPKNLAYINLKIDLLKLAGKTDQMWNFVRTKRLQLPAYKELHLYEIRHWIDAGNFKKAWELANIASVATKDPEVILLSAMLGLDVGEYARAERALLPLLDNADYASRANYYLGVSHERRGDIVKARQYYKQVKDYEHVLDAYTKVMGFYLLEGDTEKAIATLVRLRDDYPMYATDSYILQAEILLRQGEKENALNLLTVANREHPNDDRLLFASYQLLKDELGDSDKKATLDKLIDLDPYNHEYRLAEAKLRLAQNPSDPEALAVATEVSQIDGDDPMYDEALQFDALMVLAQNALANEQYQMVINYLQDAYESRLDLNAGILLLRAYQGLGESEKVMSLLSELQALSSERSAESLVDDGDDRKEIDGESDTTQNDKNAQAVAQQAIDEAQGVDETIKEVATETTTKTDNNTSTLKETVKATIKEATDKAGKMNDVVSADGVPTLDD